MAKKKKRIALRIVLIVFLVLILGIGGVAYWQRNTIQAVINSRKYSSEELQVRLDEQETALLQKISEEHPEVQVTPLSEEDTKRLQDGEITAEEAVALITGTVAEEPTVSDSGHTASAPADTPQAEEEAPKQEVSNLQNLLAQIYVLEADFNGQLNSLIAQAKQDYINDKGKTGKYAIAKRYIGTVGRLEGQCDSQMETLLSQIKTELEQIGGDTALVGEIRSAYANKKSAKKAELMEKYQ